MDFKRYGIAPYVIIGAIGVALYAIIGFILMFADPNFHFSQNCISDIGISENKSIAVLFNGSCVVCGILIMVYAVGKIVFESKLNKLAGALMVVGSVAMMLVGIFNINVDKSIHDTSAAVFAGCFISGIVFATIADILNKDKMILISGICIAIFALLGLFLTSAGSAEIIGIAAAIIWMAFQVIKYNRNGTFSFRDNVVTDGC